jgi:hypothetical protein
VCLCHYLIVILVNCWLTVILVDCWLLNHYACGLLVD